MSGHLEKIVIKAYEKPDYSGSPVGEFTAFLNPNEITLGYEIEYDSSQGSGTTNSRMNFKKVKPGDMTLVFFVDGTGVAGPKIKVQQEIEKFQTVTGYNGNIHRPNYLKIVWGNLQVKRCVLKSASIAYKVFEPSGVPIRAVINATFIDNADDRTRVAIADDRSPDLTHVRVVKEGDTLPGLCHAIYGDPVHYLAVADFNGLTSFRNLIAGTEITFPSLHTLTRPAPRS